MRNLCYGDKFEQLLQSLKEAGLLLEALGVGLGEVEGESGPAKTIVFANSKDMATGRHFEHR